MIATSIKQSGSIARRLVFGLGSVLLLILAVSLFSQWLVSNQIGRLRDAYHTERDLGQSVGDMLAGMIDQETGMRGFVLTQDEAFLEPFYKGRAKYLRSLEETRRLVQELKQQLGSELPSDELLARLDAAENQAEIWYSLVRTGPIAQVRSGDSQAAIKVISSRKSKQQFDRFRVAVAGIEQQRDIFFTQVEVRTSQNNTVIESVGVGLLAIAGLAGALTVMGLIRDLRRPLAAMEATANALGQGNFDVRVPDEVLKTNNELSLLARTFNQMAHRLDEQTLELRERDILSALRSLDYVLVEEVALDRLSQRLLERLCELTGSQLGALYLAEGEKLVLQSSIGLSDPKPVIVGNEGIIGLAAGTGRPVLLGGEASGEQLNFRTPAGDLLPRSLSAWPLLSNQKLVAVIFLGGLQALSPQARNLLESISNQLAIALVNSLGIRAIAEARSRLEATFDQMSDGVLISDAQSLPLVMNPSGRRILGFKPDEAFDHLNWAERFLAFDLEGHPLALEEQPQQRALRQGVTVRADLQLRFSEGRTVLLSVSASPLKDAGRIYGVIAVFRDVTVERERERHLSEQASELESLNANLKGANEELEMQRSELEAINEEIEQQRVQIEQQNRELLEADRQKNNFMASMSHELRTPLNAIIGFSQLLMRSKDLSGQTKVLFQLERIYENGKIQLRLVNDILDLAKIKAGKIELEYVPLDLDAFLRQTVSSLESLATQKNLAVTIEVDPRIGVIESDHQQLRTIFTNLLSNAFKYTEQGEIEVRARLLDGGYFEVQLRDTGVGIPLEQQTKVFDEFSRLEGAATRQAGTGLGLAICKRLVTLMGGDIALESTVGVGSTFTVRLPVGRVYVPLVVAPGGRAKVLFIENNPQVQQLIATRLVERPYQLLFALDTIEGIQIARSERPDAIVLDPTLPQTNLWKVLFDLRTDPTTTGIPILFQSISGERGLSIPLGLADFLSRPVGQESLLAVLRRRQVAPEGEAILIVDDSADNREYLAACLRDEGYQVQLAASGLEALAYIKQSRPQLVILDLMMPQMDGFEVLRRLREQPGNQQLPVLILSALDLSEKQRQTLLSQSEQILKKGDQSIDELLAHLDEVLKRREPA